MRLALAIVWLCPAVIAGCGEVYEAGPPTTAPASQMAHLTSAERDSVGDYEAAIVDYCRRRALGLTDPGERPSVAQQARAIDAVDELVAIAGEKPGAEIGPGVELSLFLSDLTENLEGANCDPEIVARLSAGLETLP